MVDTMEREDSSTLDTGAPVPVAVEYVEAQLSELWRDVATAAQARGGGNAVTTAHVLNLVVRADSEDSANEYTKDMQLITGRHPSRVIVVTANPEAEDMPVQAWVSIHCRPPLAGGRQVCAEQVMVRACGESVRQIPAAVIPLLLSDLPVFLWWPRNTPFDEYIFKNLSDSLDRLIVDSATFENPEGTLAKMSQRLKANWPKIACTDMNWGRITPWRELTAQFFDTPQVRPYLERIDRVTVDVALSGRGGVNRAQGLFVVSWLASRLGWQPVAPTYELVRSEKGDDLPPSARLSMKAGKRAITALINSGPWKSDHVPGELAGIKLEVLDGSGKEVEASFSVELSEKEGECAWLRTVIKGVEPVARHIQMEPPGRAELLDAELEVFSRDKVYDEALEMVGTFIRGVDPSARPNPDPRKHTSGEPMSAGAARPRPHDG